MKNVHIHTHRLLLTFALLLSSVLGAVAQYTVYTCAGDVQIKRAGKLIPAQADMKVTGADRFIVGANSSLQILNARDSRLYKCDTPGEHSISGILLDAGKESNASTLHRRMRMGKGNVEDGTMYVEKGKVTRALDTYDPAAINVQVDAALLARYVARMLESPESAPGFPAVLTTANNDSVLSFEIVNNLPEPIYVNVIAFTDTVKADYEVSPLGQPVGAYVLLPNQSLSRAQFSGTDNTKKHFIIATDYYFSIDELMNELAGIARENGPAASVLSSLPVYTSFITN